MQRIRLLGPVFVVLLGGILALAACNSNSVSGSQPKASSSTTAETKAGSSSRPQRLVDAVNSQIK